MKCAVFLLCCTENHVADRAFVLFSDTTTLPFLRPLHQLLGCGLRLPNHTPLHARLTWDASALRVGGNEEEYQNFKN